MSEHDSVGAERTYRVSKDVDVRNILPSLDVGSQLRGGESSNFHGRNVRTGHSVEVGSVVYVQVEPLVGNEIRIGFDSRQPRTRTEQEMQQR